MTRLLCLSFRRTGTHTLGEVRLRIVCNHCNQSFSDKCLTSAFRQATPLFSCHENTFPLRLLIAITEAKSSSSTSMTRLLCLSFRRVITDQRTGTHTPGKVRLRRTRLFSKNFSIFLCFAVHLRLQRASASPHPPYDHKSRILVPLPFTRLRGGARGRGRGLYHREPLRPYLSQSFLLIAIRSIRFSPSVSYR